MPQIPKVSLRYQKQESPPGISTGRASLKTAATYSPTVTQYDRRDEAKLLCSEWEEVEPSCYNHLNEFNKVMT